MEWKFSPPVRRDRTGKRWRSARSESVGETMAALIDRSSQFPPVNPSGTKAYEHENRGAEGDHHDARRNPRLFVQEKIDRQPGG